MPYLTIQIEPYGIGIKPDERLCPRCEHLMFCGVLTALANLMKAPYTGYASVAVKFCDLFHLKASLGSDEG